MKTIRIAKSLVVLLGLVGAGAGAASSSSKSATATKIVGDYVETRTASVFAGACHYNGELVTTGRDAIMAWNITSGMWRNTDLSGVRAMASVTASANLGDGHAQRKFELVVDSSASDAQVAALVDLLHAHCSAQLGQLVATRRAAVVFTRDDQHVYNVRAEGFANMSVRPMPNDECCTQPQLVWYSPLMALEHRKVGYTRSAAYLAGTNGEPWESGDENSAFYGALGF